MAYIAQSDLSPQPIPAADLVQLTDDDNKGAVDEVVLTLVLDRVTAVIDEHVAGRYTTPLTVNDQVKQLAVDLAAFWLYDRRKRVPESVKERHDAAMRLLGQIRRGEAAIDGQTVNWKVKTIDREEQPQTFGDDNLEGFK